MSDTTYTSAVYASREETESIARTIDPLIAVCELHEIQLTAQNARINRLSDRLTRLRTWLFLLVLWLAVALACLGAVKL